MSQVDIGLTEIDWAPTDGGVQFTGSGRGERRALRAVQIASLTAILAVVTFQEYELDRFFVPKELILHLAAVAAGIFLFRGVKALAPSRIDYLLVGYLALSITSAFFATNSWAAARAVGITASSLMLFWAGRSLRNAGLARPMLVALALAVVAGAATSMLQAYGVETDLFSENRSPGGTLGNRNFVAHLAAFGFPVLLFCAFRARRPAGYLVGGFGILLVTCSLVLTRSRAGWLAFAAAGFVFVVAMVISPPLRRDARNWLGFVGAFVFAAAGVAGAVLVPNQLAWRSDNPYLESMRGVANFQEGSGAGRLVQYERSLRMALGVPLLGVGPGNWAVAYPATVSASDPSLDVTAPGTTANPWPSSDWVAAIAERGFAAAGLLAFAFVAMALAALRRIRAARDVDEGLQAAALLATLGAVLVAGMFDAVLLLGLPSLLVWLTLGALQPIDDSREVASKGGGLRAMVLTLILLLAGAATVRSASQLVSMGIYSIRDDSKSFLLAATIDPGNYRLQLQLGRSGGGRTRAVRCKHALAARALYPSAAAARQLSRGCN